MSKIIAGIKYMSCYEMAIGLEVHVQLKTNTKLFSNTINSYGKEPNAQANFFDVALCGTLPLINTKAVEMAIMFGLAINANISKNSYFARKNYFYPDLPKGYQITQSHNPIVQHGKMDIKTNEGTKIIHIDRAHLEEDAGKSLHNFMHNQTGIDYNRAGMPLLEIVTQPSFFNAQEVISFLKSLHQLVKHLEICDGNMQNGSFRCDVNLSVHKKNTPLGTRVELKNINSFRFIEHAIYYEYQRQISVLESGKKIIQETRFYDSNSNKTRRMRKKENIFDYRYIPDPDLLPVILSEQQIEQIRFKMPKLPKIRQKEYAEFLEIDQIKFLMDNPNIANYYDMLVKKISPQNAFNWIKVELQTIFNRGKIPFNPNQFPVEILFEIIEHIDKEEISLKAAREVLQKYYDQPKPIKLIIKKLGIEQNNDTNFTEDLVVQSLSNHNRIVRDYYLGNKRLLTFLIGSVMKASGGKANPKKVREILLRKLK